FGETASSAEWRRACVELGARMEANAGVIVVAAVGRELQEAAFRAAGNEAAVKSVEERSRVAFELIRESGAWSDELLHGDPAVLVRAQAAPRPRVERGTRRPRVHHHRSPAWRASTGCAGRRTGRPRRPGE